MAGSAARQGESPIPVLSLTPEGMAGEASFVQWREILSIFFDVEPLHRGDESVFTGSMTTFHLGGLLMTRIAGSAVSLRRTSATIARSAVEHYLVQVHLTGGCAGLAAGREFELQAGDVGVLDLTRLLAVETTDFETLVLVVPRESLAPLVTAPDALHGLVLPAASAVGELLADHVRALYAQLPGLNVRAAAAVASGTAGLIAACVGPALDARAQAGDLHGALLDRIKLFIEDQLDSPDLGADAICAGFGLSRSNLYRLFVPLGGVAKHVRDRRLVRALEDLVTPRPDRPRIADIAYHWGFGSEASFSRAFRVAYGMAPGEARDTAEGMRRLPTQDDGAVDRVLRRWIRSLTAR